MVCFKEDSNQDFNGTEVKEGDTLTFDWFDYEDPINDMRRKFANMKDWSDKKIYDRIHRPIFIVKKNEKGILFGEGIEQHTHMGRLYLHSFRFKYTKLVL